MPKQAKPTTLFPSPSAYSDDERARLIDALNLVTADLLDLELAAYLAHRTIRGEYFGCLHRLFGDFAGKLSKYTDSVPEFVAMLGGQPVGSCRQIAKMSRLDDYPEEITDGIEHCRELAKRIKAAVAGLHEAAVVADEVGAPDALDLVTKVMGGVEKFGWMIAAHVVGDEDGEEGPESKPAGKREK
jgi:starvation-inducible DNA-binding protein